MKIVFFGSPASALPSLQRILDAGHSVELVITQPDRPSGRGRKPSPPPVKEFALVRGLPIHQPEKIRNDPSVLDLLRRINPDIHVVVAYGQIIPSSIIYFPGHNSINVHFSLLPKYRGASPVQWAILNGETETGVTIFELNEKMDEGDILSQVAVPILPGETAAGLESRLAEIGADLLLDTLSRLPDIEPVKQDHSLATYAPKLRKEDGRIDWSKEASSIDRQVRAMTPWPSAFAFHKKKRVKILKGCCLETGTFPSRPGKVIGITKEGIAVECGGGSLYRIERLQPEDKSPMSGHAFSLGARLNPGDSFS